MPCSALNVTRNSCATVFTQWRMAFAIAAGSASSRQASKVKKGMKCALPSPRCATTMVSSPGTMACTACVDRSMNAGTAETGTAQSAVRPTPAFLLASDTLWRISQSVARDQAGFGGVFERLLHQRGHFFAAVGVAQFDQHGP